MSDFLNQLKTYELGQFETRKSVAGLKQTILHNAAEDTRVRKELQGKIVLDPSKDPDPYSLHGIPLSTRLIEMGWRQ